MGTVRLSHIVPKSVYSRDVKTLIDVAVQSLVVLGHAFVAHRTLEHGGQSSSLLEYVVMGTQRPHPTWCEALCASGLVSFAAVGLFVTGRSCLPGLANILWSHIWESFT